MRPAIGRRELRKVDKLSTVRFASARYSVPNRMLGQTVEVVASGQSVTIVAAGTGEVLAEHIRRPPGEASILDEHYGRSRPVPPGRKARPRSQAETTFLALGEVAETWLRSAAGSGNTRLGRELEQLADLEAAHGRDALRAALERAVTLVGGTRPASGRSCMNRALGYGLKYETDFRDTHLGGIGH